MRKYLILLLAFVSIDARSAEVTCELRFEGTVEVPRSCELAPAPVPAVTSRTAEIAPRTSLQTAANPFGAEVGLDMSKMLFSWVKDAWSGNPTVKTGQLITLSGGKPVSTVDLFDARIVEVKIPTLDGNSKDPLYFDIKFQPTSIKYRSGGKSTSKGVSGVKSSLASNFRVEIGGLPTDYVVKVDAFTWMAPALDPRRRGFVPVSFPHVVLTIAMKDWDAWVDWVSELAIQGSLEPGQSKIGHIAFLSNDLKSELGRIALVGIVPRSIGILTPDANAPGLAGFQVKLGISRMEFYRP